MSFGDFLAYSDTSAAFFAKIDLFFSFHHTMSLFISSIIFWMSRNNCNVVCPGNLSLEHHWYSVNAMKSCIHENL